MRLGPDDGEREIADHRPVRVVAGARRVDAAAPSCRPAVRSAAAATDQRLQHLDPLAGRRGLVERLRAPAFGQPRIASPLVASLRSFRVFSWMRGMSPFARFRWPARSLRALRSAVAWARSGDLGRPASRHRRDRAAPPPARAPCARDSGSSCRRSAWRRAPSARRSRPCVSSSSRSWLTTIAPPRQPASRSMTARAAVAVEIVGRLVEQDEVGLGEDQRGERRRACVVRPTASPAACRRARRGRAGRARRRCRASSVQSAWARSSAVGLAAFGAAQQREPVGRAEQVGDGLAGSAWTVWRSTPSVPLTTTVPDCGGRSPAIELEQRGLADAVAADQAGALAAEAQIEIGKERPAVRRGPGEIGQQ